ncbi:MAG: hypothetical protein ACFE89_09825 [Candidatus Hodarchaeota archaeon]
MAIVFISIIILLACIVCVAIQNTQPPPPQQYVRTSPQDPWVPIQEPHLEERKWESAQYQVTIHVCSCGKWNNPQQSKCWHCSTSLAEATLQSFTFDIAQKCAVCRFDVFPGDRIVLCPACQSQGHRTHMLEYLKAKGYCPTCNTQFNSQQILETFPGPPKTQT